jgi:hypothetical protein
VPFLKKIWSKRAISVWYDGKIFLLPPVANISGKKILGALFNTLEAGAPRSRCPPPNLLMLPTPLSINFDKSHLQSERIIP